MSLDDFQPKLVFTGLTINSAGTETDSIDLKGHTLVGLRAPADMASATLSFQSADESTGTYSALRTSTGGAVTITSSSAAAYQYTLDPDTFAGLRHLKVIPASTADAAKELTLITRPA